MQAMLRHQQRHNTSSLQSTSIPIDGFVCKVSRNALHTDDGRSKVYYVNQGSPLQFQFPPGSHIHHLSSRIMITTIDNQVKIQVFSTAIKNFDHIASNPPSYIGDIKFDKLKQEFIIKDLRFKINQDLSISQVSHKPLPLNDGRKLYIATFHHPHYICHNGNALLLMKFDDQQQQYQQVSRLVAELRIHSFFVDFYPFKSSIISV